MLIQITNKCQMGCPHCMQDSNPNGEHMTDETFKRVFMFCKGLSPIVISITGGEPTEHPKWDKYALKLLSLHTVAFVNIMTNGAWLKKRESRQKMERFLRKAGGFANVIVYSNPKYYKNHEWTVAHEEEFKRMGCKTDFTSPIYMQDLGRARVNCTEEIEKNRFSPSCINSHLLARQSKNFRDFIFKCSQTFKFCRPLIDTQGYIHMSESALCPPVAHIRDKDKLAFSKIVSSVPCKGCKLYKNFLKYHPSEVKFLESQRMEENGQTHPSGTAVNNA